MINVIYVVKGLFFLIIINKNVGREFFLISEELLNKGEFILVEIYIYYKEINWIYKIENW